MPLLPTWWNANGRTAWSVSAVWSAVALLEFLNRHVLYLLPLYPGLEDAGTLWAWLMSLAGATLGSGRATPSWRWGLVAWVTSIVGFVLTHQLLVGDLRFDRNAVQWLLPFFYGMSFGAVAWMLAAAVRHFSSLPTVHEEDTETTEVTTIETGVPGALTTSERAELQGALLSAFPTPGQLNQLVLLGEGLGVTLAQIATPAPLPEMVTDVIQWAEANGRIDNLIEAAYQRAPDNPRIRRCYDLHKNR